MCSRPPLCLLHAYSSRLLVQSCSSLPSTRYFLSIQDLVPLKCSDTVRTARTSLHSPPDVAATTQTAPKPCYQHRTSHQAQPNSKTKASQTSLIAQKQRPPDCTPEAVLLYHPKKQGIKEMLLRGGPHRTWSPSRTSPRDNWPLFPAQAKTSSAVSRPK